MRCDLTRPVCPMLLSVAFVMLTGSVLAADHGDSPLLTSIPRHDARITDLHVFTEGSNLVLSLCTNPAIPPGARDYVFPSDLTLKLSIDNHGPVAFDDPVANESYGGRLLQPGGVAADITFEVTFEFGAPQLRLEGLPASAAQQISLFAGLRDDPFIRGPRLGRNVAALVLEMPLAMVLGEGDTLLVWATSKIPDVRGRISEHAGRALRSMFLANDVMNTSSPSNHWNDYELVPDVVILNVSQPVGYPNGRLLTDDVVDLTAIPAILANDAPFPSENDVPFLEVFPYLAPPQ